MSRDTLNPSDINDPEWLAAREAEWKVEAKDLKKWFSKSYLEDVRKYFFGAEFEFSEDSDLKDAVRRWNFSPFQSETLWEERIIKYAHKMLAGYEKKRGVIWEDKLPIAIRSYAGGFATTLDDPHEQVRLWGIDKAVALKKLVYGDHFVNGSYEIFGFTVSYPLTPAEFISNWLTGFRRWMMGYVSDDSGDCLPNRFVSHFIEAYHSLHPLLFGTKLLLSSAEQNAQWAIRSLVADLKSYNGDLTEWVSEKKLKKMTAEDREWRHQKLVELSALLSQPTGIKHIDDFWVWIDPNDKDKCFPDEGSKHYKELSPEEDPFYVPPRIHGGLE
ncbi:MAG: hypothetical protein KBT87_05935 [Gammaproteobacteria bacterium]|nr:hypothetical protein [Gammaproteobacteria bacterium]MBQ0774194.1 hypothetical protein [Gammaproteobacteria bacterium]